MVLDYLQNNRSLTAIMIFLSIGLSSFARSPESGQTEEKEEPLTEAILRDDIKARDETLPAIKKKDEKIEILQDQVTDLTLLVGMLDQRIVTLTRRIDEPKAPDYSVWPLPLLVGDESIFTMESLPGRTVPEALAKHYETVCIVWKITERLDDTDKKIASATSFSLQNDIDANALIRQTIQPNVDELFELFTRYMSSDQSSLSQKQSEYAASLKQRYNNLKKYFE